MTRDEEITQKLKLLRGELQRRDAGAVWLKGTDWFFWATGGADNTVLLASEVGVAQVLITQESAWILTNEIEAERLRAEQPTPGLELHVFAWTDNQAELKFVLAQAQGRLVLSDRPTADQAQLSPDLYQTRMILMPAEKERYREIGKLASDAITEVLTQAKPQWTELELTGAAAECLWSRGLHPALIMAAGETRIPLYRHPLPTTNKLGGRAMVVFCARRQGLYANLSRTISFLPMDGEWKRKERVLQDVEAAALEATRPGAQLKDIYQLIAQAYVRNDYPRAIAQHHQGGLTGYAAREVIAQPASEVAVRSNMAVAWNPSLPGAKIEDTFLVDDARELENITFNPQWPHEMINGRKRPVVWLR